MTNPSPALNEALAAVQPGRIGVMRWVLCAQAAELDAALTLCRLIEGRGVACQLHVDLGEEGRDGLAGPIAFVDGSMHVHGILSRVRPLSQILKRTLDIVGALFGLLILALVLLVVGSRIKADGGPLFFGHRRVGRHGRPFRCLKLRSMGVDADEILAEFLASDPDAESAWEQDFKLKEDPG